MRLLALVLVVTAATGLAAQDSPIEVVSIKPTAPGAAGGSFGTRPGGGIVTVNMSMASLISLAYELPNSSNIDKAPDWFNREGFDVNARYSTPQPDPGRLREAWRAVFAERFKLKARIEPREVQAFNVVLAQPERGVPPGLTRIDVDCAARQAAFRKGEKLQELTPLPSGILPCNSSYAGTTITSGGMPISQFLRSIQNGAGGILVDKTGLEANYAFTLKSASRRPGVVPDPDGPPDLITALREQLGLRLQPTRAMTEYLVIEHIERPTPD
jgi:uncharacterized protein (TIGR03435 family)